MKKRIWLGALLAAVGVLALSPPLRRKQEGSNGTGGGGGGGVTALPASSCNAMQCKGSGSLTT